MVIAITVVTLSILPIVGIGCEQVPHAPKMTAPEVRQHVNQTLTNEYIYLSDTLRYEFHYTALSAQNIYADIWQLEVKVTVEPQQLVEGQWSFGEGIRGVTPFVQQYQFNETTRELTKVKQ